MLARFLCFGWREGTPWLGCLRYLLEVFSISYRNHISHQSHIPVFLHLPKFLSLSFSILILPATFLPGFISGPLVISKRTRGQREK